MLSPSAVVPRARLVDWAVQTWVFISRLFVADVGQFQGVVALEPPWPSPRLLSPPRAHLSAGRSLCDLGRP